MPKKIIQICSDDYKKSFKFGLKKNNYAVFLDENLFYHRDYVRQKIKKKFGSISDFKIVNSEINIYSKNGYLLSFNFSNGNLVYQKRINKNGIQSKIIFLNDNMFFVDNDNKLLKFN